MQIGRGPFCDLEPQPAWGFVPPPFASIKSSKFVKQMPPEHEPETARYGYLGEKNNALLRKVRLLSLTLVLSVRLSIRGNPIFESKDAWLRVDGLELSSLFGQPRD